MPQKKYSYPQHDSEVEKEVATPIKEVDIPVQVPVKSKPVPPPVLKPASKPVSKAVCNLPPAMAAWQLLHSPKGR
jgi:hypothetical protein